MVDFHAEKEDIDEMEYFVNKENKDVNEMAYFIVE